jgi:ParB-like chromosome segregation protein Spo0J
MIIISFIEEMSDEQAIEIAVIENLQREDLSPLDEAAIFARMTTELGYSIRKLADKLGKDKGYIENRLRLVAAPADVRALVAERSDTISHAYELMKIDDPARRAELAAQIARGELSLARLKSVVRGESDRPSLGAPAPATEVAFTPAPVVHTAPPAPAAPFTPPSIIQNSSVPAASEAAAPVTETSDAGLMNARESVGNAIDELATILHAIDRADGSVKLNELDRMNMAKWLQIARNKLDNLAAILRQKGE